MDLHFLLRFIKCSTDNEGISRPQSICFRNLLMGGVVLKESESNEQCLAVYSSWDSGGSHCLIKNHTSEASYVL